MPSLILRRPARALAALLTATTLTLVSCTGEEVDTSVEAPVGLAVDAPRVTLQSAGEGPGRTLVFDDITEDPDAAQQHVTIEVSEGFDQSLMRADTVEVQAPAGGDVTTLTLPMNGHTAAAPEPEPDSDEQDGHEKGTENEGEANGEGEAGSEAEGEAGSEAAAPVDSRTAPLSEETLAELALVISEKWAASMESGRLIWMLPDELGLMLRPIAVGD